jgi:hypothetical protein
MVHRTATGTPIQEAIYTREAEVCILKPGIAAVANETSNLHMSHQTGAGLLRLSFQITELMNRLRTHRPVQAILRHVPTFQADSELEFIWYTPKINSKSPCMCRRRGIQQSTNPMKENNENILLEVVILGIYCSEKHTTEGVKEHLTFLSSI